MRKAFEIAEIRKRKLVSVDKHNVLEASNYRGKLYWKFPPEYKKCEIRVICKNRY